MKHCIECGAAKSRKGEYCKPCGYKYRTRPSGLNYKLTKVNPTSFKKGHRPWNTGLPSPLRKENPGYDALHEWVERWAIDPKACTTCGSTKNLEWSNISGSYKRELSDWQRLCKRCHCKFDNVTFGARKAFYRE